jgi:excisionase family DNA binding protein
MTSANRLKDLPASRNGVAASGPPANPAGGDAAGRPAPWLGLLTALEAARFLAVSPRKLWQLTKDRQVKALKLGRSVRYDVRDLQEFVDRLRAG